MKKYTPTAARRLRRGIQACSLLAFLGLLGLTFSPLPGAFVPVDLFLRLDPLTATAVPLAAREWIPSLLPGLGILLLALFAGRIFCGYLCPMGTSLDIARFFVGKKSTGKGVEIQAGGFPLRRAKYLILAAVLGAALVGVNAAFWASPIPLITRFYALLAHPVLLLLGSEGLSLTRPLLEGLDLTVLTYTQIPIRRFDTLYFVGGLFALLFFLERVRPRFWCRYLCPAGALLALFSFRPFWRRAVSECSGCGRCSRNCPSEAIGASGTHTAHGECLTCRACVDVCPVQGTAFTLRSPAEKSDAPVEERPASPPPRRAFLLSAGAGALYAAVQLSGTHSLLSPESKGSVWPTACIRPPGSLPEPAFLDRCVRCGQCMKVCPTNGLQPAWFAAGPEGVFSPVLVARRGPCEPDCAACGQVCPTGAIRKLPLEEKRWAKMGTAIVMQSACLAWAEGKRCVVCEEVCPYGAITSVQQSGARVAVPVVNAASCYGCGYCEQFCPVRIPAIVVQPLNFLRLSTTNYKESARNIGLNLQPASKSPEGGSADSIPEGSLPPGFTE